MAAVIPPTPAEVESAIAKLRTEEGDTLTLTEERIILAHVASLERRALAVEARASRYRRALEQIADSDVNHRWLARAALANDDGDDKS